MTDKVQVNMRLKEPLAEELENRADDSGRSPTGEAQEIVRRELNGDERYQIHFIAAMLPPTTGLFVHSLSSLGIISISAFGSLAIAFITAVILVGFYQLLNKES